MCVPATGSENCLPPLTISVSRWRMAEVLIIEHSYEDVRGANYQFYSLILNIMWLRSRTGLRAVP
jgi:hypothetical protein